MIKIIGEILRLVWKALRLLLWKWLAQLMGRLFFYVIVVIGFVLLLLMIADRL